MGEADRARRQDVAARLAVLHARHGDLATETATETPTASLDPDPSWGPVGSLARQQMTAPDLAHLLALHNDMLALERARKAADIDPEVLH